MTELAPAGLWCGVERWVCPYCQRDALDGAAMAEHIRLVHPPAPADAPVPLGCPHCPANFLEPERLAEHIALSHPPQDEAPAPRPRRGRRGSAVAMEVSSAANDADQND